jgi:hypothetical protein
MHIHLPKPLHGWRAFVGEVGIIVIGVLIALGAEQAVEALHGHRLADETRTAVRDEIDNDLTNLKLRATAEPCVVKRLSELHAIVDEWGRTGAFKTPSWVSQTPVLTVDLPHYDAATSAGHLALLPREEQYRIGVIVAKLRSFQQFQESEFQTWPDLRMLQSGASALSLADRTAVRQALQRAAVLDFGVRLLIAQVLPRASAYGFKPDMHRFNERAKTIWKNGLYSPSICLPIDTPPAQANAMSGSQVSLPF